jgi:hypothetical protein
MSEYELAKKLGSYDNFKGLKSMAKVPRHKLFARNKHSAPTVGTTACTCTYTYLTFNFMFFKMSFKGTVSPDF